jgi:hypothetical protein
MKLGIWRLLRKADETGPHIASIPKKLEHTESNQGHGLNSTGHPHILCSDPKKVNMMYNRCVTKKIRVAHAQLRCERDAGGKCGIM